MNVNIYLAKEEYSNLLFQVPISKSTLFSEIRQKIAQCLHCGQEGFDVYRTDQFRGDCLSQIFDSVLAMELIAPNERSLIVKRIRPQNELPTRWRQVSDTLEKLSELGIPQQTLLESQPLIADLIRSVGTLKGAGDEVSFFNSNPSSVSAVSENQSTAFFIDEEELVPEGWECTDCRRTDQTHFAKNRCLGCFTQWKSGLDIGNPHPSSPRLKQRRLTAASVDMTASVPDSPTSVYSVIPEVSPQGILQKSLESVGVKKIVFRGDIPISERARVQQILAGRANGLNREAQLDFLTSYLDTKDDSYLAVMSLYEKQFSSIGNETFPGLSFLNQQLS